jgi:uncharacterized membrane protein
LGKVATRDRQCEAKEPSMNNNNRRPLEHLILGLVVSVVCLELLASILPHVLVPLVILATVVVIVRLVFFHTRRW